MGKQDRKDITITQVRDDRGIGQDGGSKELKQLNHGHTLKVKTDRIY